MDAAERRRRALEMHRLYTDGWTTQQVADRFGVALSTVKRAFRVYGLPRRGQTKVPAERWEQWYPDEP